MLDKRNNQKILLDSITKMPKFSKTNMLANSRSNQPTSVNPETIGMLQTLCSNSTSENLGLL